MPKTGATVAADDGRRLLLMVCAGTGWPETFFGDVSVGTLATARSLDRPTELRLRNRQTLWSDIIIDIAQFVIDKKLESTQGLKKGQVDRTINTAFPPIVQHDVKEIVDAIV